jgi:hypothetical protein
MTEGFVAWRDKNRNQMEVFEFSAGGFGILNVPDEATLQLTMMEYSFGPFSKIQVRPILDGDTALAQWQQAMKAMGSS